MFEVTRPPISNGTQALPETGPPDWYRAVTGVVRDAMRAGASSASIDVPGRDTPHEYQREAVSPDAESWRSSRHVVPLLQLWLSPNSDRVGLGVLAAPTAAG